MKRITALLTVTIICAAIACFAQWERRTVEVSDYYLDRAYAIVTFEIDSDSGGSFGWEVTYSDDRGSHKTRDSRSSWRSGETSVSGRVLIGRDSSIRTVRVLWVNEN